MKTLLVIDSSSRTSRSHTRSLTLRFRTAWKLANPDGTVINRDLGQQPPPPVDQSWIAAAFTPPESMTEANRQAVRLSDSLIDELIGADEVVIGSPLYNFGMPAQLKAYFDQIVRVGRTFALQPDQPTPYRPLLGPKVVTVVTAAGDNSFNYGGPLYHLNFLEPHLRTILEFIGLANATFIRVGDDEYQGERFRTSLEAAEKAIDDLFRAPAPIA